MNAAQHRLRHIDYIDHMLEATRLARSYVEGLDKDGYLADKKTQQAVILNILVIGEASTQMLEKHPEFAARHPEIPWAKMRGMRNRMAHGYFDANLDIVWETVQQALPELEAQLIQIHEKQ